MSGRGKRSFFSLGVVLMGGARRFEYVAGVCFGMSVCGMHVRHVGWTSVDVSVRCVGSLRCGMSAGSSSVVLRVSRHVRSCTSMPLCFLFGSLASIAYACCIWSRVFGVVLLLMERMDLHLCITISHMRARCFRSVLE